MVQTEWTYLGTNTSTFGVFVAGINKKYAERHQNDKPTVQIRLEQAAHQHTQKIQASLNYTSPDPLLDKDMANVEIYSKVITDTEMYSDSEVEMDYESLEHSQQDNMANFLQHSKSADFWLEAVASNQPLPHSRETL